MDESKKIINVNSPLYEEFAADEDFSPDWPPRPTTARPTTTAPTTARPTTAAPTTAAPTTTAPTPTPCPCCFSTERRVDYDRCELVEEENIETVVNCVGRFLDVTVTLRNVCPNKWVAVGVLVYDAQNRLLSFKVCRLFTGDGPNCIPSLNSGRFCFVFDENDSCPGPRTFTVRTVSNYLER